MHSDEKNICASVGEGLLQVSEVAGFALEEGE